MNYKYIKSISYSIGTKDNKTTKEKVLEMRRKYKKISKKKEVFATAR